jgi:hypothetical protein
MDPAIVLLATWALGLTSPNARTWLNIAVVILGVTMTAFGEIKFVLSGFLFQVAGRFFESFRLALIQKVLSGEENRMDPLVSLYYFTPVCAVMIGAVSAFAELPHLQMEDINEVGVGLLLANAAAAFLLNVAGVILVRAIRSSRPMLTSTDWKDICVDFAIVGRSQDYLLDLRFCSPLGCDRNADASYRLYYRHSRTVVLFAWEGKASLAVVPVARAIAGGRKELETKEICQTQVCSSVDFALGICRRDRWGIRWL